MAFGFNPFTGNFDLTGGGDAAPFAGQVDAYADLPLDTTAALNSRWLVKNNSGTWPFSTYKQAGIYIRVNTLNSSRDTDYQFVGTLPSVMNDSEFLVYDDTDATKNLKFQLSGITTGTTRTLTVPNASGTIARTETFAAPPAIGNTTAAAGSFTTLSASDALTASNATASPPTTLTATKGVQWLLPATAYAAITGIYPGSPAISLLTGSVGGMSEHARFSLSGITFNSPLTAAAGTFTTLTANTSLTLNGTGAAELINAGAAAGPLRIYNTFTSATNHERGFLRWSSNVFQIGTEKGSAGGTARALEFQTDGVTRMTIGATGTITVGFATWTSTGGINTFAVNINNAITLTQDLGLLLSNTSPIRFFPGSTFIQSSADTQLRRVSAGLLEINNNTAGQFRDLSLRALLFEGTTSSFPALKRSSTTLQVRLADDTAFAPLACGALTLNGNLDASTRDIVTDITTGTKIGTATSQKIGFFNATPVVQQAAVADATDAASTQDRLNDLLARLRTLGLIAT